MQKYGIIKEGNLYTNSKQIEGYKPIEYARMPSDFDQTTQYITQSTPIDRGDHIYAGVELHELPKDLNEGDIDEGEFVL